ncbi:MAG: putative DNA binding domain-containing protein [Lachnospiraceae bacterium]|nr:putative DNA binding domain-containing protein [Lachnospiraceae bacterium]
MNFGKENETLEFKKTTGEIREAMISISSILNKHGVGTLYFGIKPNGDVIGQDVTESSLRDVSRAIYESIKPQIYPAIEELIVDGRQIIRVEFSGNDTPYSAYGKYYLRTADEDREVTPTVLKQFFIVNEYKEQWEKSPSSAKIKQCDRTTIKNFVNKAIAAGRLPEGKYSSNAVLNRFGLMKEEYLTNAGETLFGNTHPVTLKAAVFATDEKLTFLDMKMYEDNILNLLQIAEEYILKNIRWRAEIVGLDRTETPEIPVAVIREALANSFAHAQYNSNTTHEICIHPGMVTIYSPGTYASTFKPEEYIKKNVQSSIRNVSIAKILYLNNSIEQFGSGFKRISSLCKDAGVKYSYEATPEGFKLTFYRKRLDNVTANDTANVTVNKTEQAVLTLLEMHPNYTREQLADATSKTVRTMQRVLNSLRDKNLISREGSDKDGYWIVCSSVKK